MGRSKVSALTTLVMSLIWATSSLAATRGGDVLTASGGGEEDVAVVAGDGQTCAGDVFCEAVFQAYCVGVDDFGDTGDLGSGLCGGTGVVASDEDVHVAAAKLQQQ